MSTNPASSVRVIRIWTDYMNKAGKIVPVDKVEYCAVGMAGKASTISPVSHVSRVRQPTGNDDVSAIMANVIWDAIRPQYEAFKRGSELPENGTPLGAWNAVTPEQAQVLKLAGFRSVEEIASANDSVLSRIQLPGARGLVEQAKMFLESTDRSKAAAMAAEKDAIIAALKEDQEEMKQLLLEMQAQLAEAKPRRGRPPKVDADLEGEAA